MLTGIIQEGLQDLMIQYLQLKLDFGIKDQVRSTASLPACLPARQPLRLSVRPSVCLLVCLSVLVWVCLLVLCTGVGVCLCSHAC